MNESQENKLIFRGKYGSAKDIEDNIKIGDEPGIRASTRNVNFTRAHHEQMMNDERLPIRRLAMLYSPHTTSDDITKTLARDHHDNATVGYAISHDQTTKDHLISVAMHPTINHVVKKSAVSYLYTKGHLTPDLLRDIENAPNPPQIPLHIWNNTLNVGKHVPLTHKDVNNALVRERGGRLL